MKRFVLLTTTALLALALIGVGQSVIAEDQATPGDTVKALAKALEQGDAEKLKQLIPEINELLGDEKIQQMADQAAEDLKEEGGLKSVTINSEKIQGDTATVNATLEKGNGDKDTDDFELKKTDGKWVIKLGLEEKQLGAPDDDPPPDKA